MENKTIYADIFVPGNTDPVNEALLIPQCTEGRHEPTIAVASLAHVSCGRPIDEELRFLKDVL